MLLNYIPIFILILLAVLFGGVSLFASSVFGPQRPTPAKLSPYECGVTPVGTARGRFSVKFYLVALLFILFDIETIFLYPWAVVFRSLKTAGFLAMLTFLGVLGIGLLYVWRKGALEWE